MGRLTTHVLDTAAGKPAVGMGVRLFRFGADAGGSAPAAVLLRAGTTNADGRIDPPLLADDALLAGRYRLEFAVGAYFGAMNPALPDPPFLDIVPIEFGIADAQAHYHVPLLVSPWSYSTYRGS